jgi:hypothetical protein
MFGLSICCQHSERQFGIMAGAIEIGNHLLLPQDVAFTECYRILGYCRGQKLLK